MERRVGDVGVSRGRLRAPRGMEAVRVGGCVERKEDVSVFEMRDVCVCVCE